MTASAIEDRRIDALTSLYMRDRITLEEFEFYVAQALQGQQPMAATGIPLIADPALHSYVTL